MHVLLVTKEVGGCLLGFVYLYYAQPSVLIYVYNAYKCVLRPQSAVQQLASRPEPLNSRGIYVRSSFYREILTNPCKAEAARYFAYACTTHTISASCAALV